MNKNKYKICNEDIITVLLLKTYDGRNYIK